MILADFTKQVGVWYFLYQYLKVSQFIPHIIQPQPVQIEHTYSFNQMSQMSSTARINATFNLGSLVRKTEKWLTVTSVACISLMILTQVNLLLNMGFNAILLCTVSKVM